MSTLLMLPLLFVSLSAAEAPATETPAAETPAPTLAMRFEVDPISRYVHVIYRVPDTAPREVTASCTVSLDEGASWQTASVQPMISDAARRLYPSTAWKDAVVQGRIVERGAAGLERTAVWNPFVCAPGDKTVRFRVVLTARETELARGEIPVELKNSDVVVIDDWSKVYQTASVSASPETGAPVWLLKDNGHGGFSLDVAQKGVELPPLTYPLDLSGPYAIFVATPEEPITTIDIRLSGDDRCDTFSQAEPGSEVFWRRTEMTGQHLVVQQAYQTVYEYEDTLRSRLDRVRFVPLSAEVAKGLDAAWRRGKDLKLVAAYYEPYSWAFFQDVRNNPKHWEPLSAFAAIPVDFLDTQIGRGGMRMVFETRKASQLIGGTYGDDIRGKTPETGNVGRMQQYTNMLNTTLRYGTLLGLTVRANIGATNCYPGTSLESDFSKQHPEWRLGHTLDYRVPEVRQYVLSLFEEALRIGARNLSLDWCRYPSGIQDTDTPTLFFRELRALANKYSTGGKRITTLTRFPATGDPKAPFMDYRTWVKEGLVDYLCPSLNAGNKLDLLGFDIGEYLAATRGTNTKLLPDIFTDDAFVPGIWMQRAMEVYDQGAQGIYIYQADYVAYQPEGRRYAAVAAAADSLKRWAGRERALQPRYSKGIYKIDCDTNFYVWTEGLSAEIVEVYDDNELVRRFDKPPYRFPATKNPLKIRVKDGSGWFEETFPGS